MDNRTIEYMPLAELVTRLHPDNPKDHNIGAIIESYKAHGYVASGVIDQRTGLFLAGHGRTIALNVMQKQGMDAPDGIRNGGDDWLVPVQVGYESKSDVQAKAYIVADNKLTIAGGWNEPALASLLEEVAASADVALESTGFSGDSLDEILASLSFGLIGNDIVSDNIREANSLHMTKRGVGDGKMVNLSFGDIMVLLPYQLYADVASYVLGKSEDTSELMGNVLRQGLLDA